MQRNNVKIERYNMDGNKRHANSPMRNQNIGVDTMGEPPNSGDNDLMETMKAFNDVYSEIHTNSTGHSGQDMSYQPRAWEDIKCLGYINKGEHSFENQYQKA